MFYVQEEQEEEEEEEGKEEEEEEEDDKSKGRSQRGGSAVVPSRTRVCSIIFLVECCTKIIADVFFPKTELTAEERRHEHQKKLAEKVQREALERNAGHREKEDEKKFAF